MKIAWVMGGGCRRLVVDLIPKSTVVGLGQLQGYTALVPIIVLSYSLEYLEKFSPVLQEMQKLRLVPHVHIWNRTKQRPGPELRVDFRIPCAGLTLLERFAPCDMLEALQGVDGLTSMAELCIGSAGNTDRRATENFFRVLKKTGVAVVIVNEDEAHKKREYREEVSPPIAKFLVRTIGTEAPPPIEL